MALPKKYLPLPSPIVPTYTGTDVITGKGTLKLWATSANWSDNDPPSGSSILTANQVDCGMYTLGGGANHPRYTFMVNTTKTFTLSAFTRPTILNGDAYVNFTIAHSSTGSGTSTWTVSIEKNGTSLVSGSCLLTPGGASVISSFNFPLAIPRTDFIPGDALKLSISNTMTATAKAYLVHDSINRDIAGHTPGGGNGNFPALTATTNPTQLVVYIPEEIQI